MKREETLFKFAKHQPPSPTSTSAEEVVIDRLTAQGLAVPEESLP